MDLSSSMRSPGLDLEPPPGLADAVRGRARRVRRRQRVTASALGVAAVAAGALLVPGVAGRSSTGELATAPEDTHGVRGATSRVVVLQEVNGGEVVGYYVGDAPCVGVVRVKSQQHCAPGVSALSPSAVPYVFPDDDPSLRIDTTQLVAGVAGTGVAAVRVVLRQGAPVPARLSGGRGFTLPLFSAELPRDAVVVRVEGLDATGTVVGRQQPAR